MTNPRDKQIAQSKKEAKRLLKLNRNNPLALTQLADALEIVAKLKGFPSWHAYSTFDGISNGVAPCLKSNLFKFKYTVPNGDLDFFDFFERPGFSLITGRPGSGKTTAWQANLLHRIQIQPNQKCRVVILGGGLNLKMALEQMGRKVLHLKGIDLGKIKEQSLNQNQSSLNSDQKMNDLFSTTDFKLKTLSPTDYSFFDDVIVDLEYLDSNSDIQKNFAWCEYFLNWLDEIQLAQHPRSQNQMELEKTQIIWVFDEVHRFNPEHLQKMIERLDTNNSASQRNVLFSTQMSYGMQFPKEHLHCVVFTDNSNLDDTLINFKPGLLKQKMWKDLLELKNGIWPLAVFTHKNSEWDFKLALQKLTKEQQWMLCTRMDEQLVLNTTIQKLGFVRAVETLALGKTNDITLEKQKVMLTL